VIISKQGFIVSQFTRRALKVFTYVSLCSLFLCSNITNVFQECCMSNIRVFGKPVPPNCIPFCPYWAPIGASPLIFVTLNPVEINSVVLERSFKEKLTEGQYNVTGCGIILFCGMVRRCAGTLTSICVWSHMLMLAIVELFAYEVMLDNMAAQEIKN